MERVDDGPSLVWRLVFAVVAVLVVLTVIGWIIGAILNALKLVFVIGGAIAIIWAIASARAGRD